MGAAEQSARMPPMPPSLDSPYAAMLAQLQAARAGPQFSQLYVQMQTQARQAVGLFTTYARSGDNPVIVAFASQTLPVLEHHLRHIDDIAGVGPVGPTASRRPPRNRPAQ